MIPFRRYVSTAVGVLIALTLAASLAAAIDARAGGHMYGQLALIPGRVWEGQLWRLVSWTFVEGAPLPLIFTCVTLYWFGGDLASSWGQQRFVRFVGAMVLIASGGTTLFAVVAPWARWRLYLGGWALGDALVIAWALQFPERRIRIYSVLVVGGPLLAYGTFAFTALCAVFYGVTPFLPPVLAGGAALLYMTRSLRKWWLKIERFRIKRKLRSV